MKRKRKEAKRKKNARREPGLTAAVRPMRRPGPQPVPERIAGTAIPVVDPDA